MATFTNKQTIAQVKAAQGGAQFQIQEANERPGLFFFSCGADSGYCSKAAAQATSADQLMVCDVTADDGQVYHMCTLAGGGLAKHTVRSF